LAKNSQEQENEIIRRFLMRVRVIQNKCGSVGMCVKTCPDIFRFQEGSKKATVVEEKVPPHLEQKCFKAAGLCPNKAVAVFFE
jgi:ferredoxin